MVKSGSLVVLALLVLLASCAPAPEPAPVRAGPYLGETPPGAEAALFAPELIASALSERDAAWSPDGEAFYFTVFHARQGTIFVVRLEDGVWAGPHAVSFSGEFSDLEPFLSADGQEFYFVSNRPRDADEEPEYRIWVSRRGEAGWGEPVALPAPIDGPGREFYPSIDADGRLYFTATREDGIGGEDIYMAERDGEGWAEPVNLGAAVNSPQAEYNSLIARDGSYLLYTSTRPGEPGGGDIFVAFRGEDGAFLEAQRLPAPVNTKAHEYCPGLSADGSVFFFTSSRTSAAPQHDDYEALRKMAGGPDNARDNIYWVDAAVIEALRP